MRRTKFWAVTILSSGALLVVPSVSSAATGQGWDVFDGYTASYQGEHIDPMGRSSSRGSNASKGFDVLNLEKEIHASEQSYMGTSLEEPSGDSDVFRTGVK